MSEAKRDAWTGKRLAEVEILYRRYTTQYYGFGGPHPLKAPAEIRSRMARAPRAHRRKMELALAYAIEQRRAWIADLRSEERYLRAAGWKSRPFEHKEFMGDHDTWISPHNEDEFSRSGAIEDQCMRDAGLEPKVISWPEMERLARQSRRGAAPMRKSQRG